MDDMSRQKEIAKEKMLEAMLEYAGACHVENIANETMEEDVVPYPSELDIKIKKIIAKHERESRVEKILQNIRKSAPRVAMVLFAILACFTLTIASVEAFRVKFINFIIETEKKYTSIDMKEKEPEVTINDELVIPSEWDSVYVPEFIPSSYKISETQTLTTVKIILYTDSQNNMITFNQYSDKNTNIKIDTENAQVDSILINGFEGLAVYKEGTITLIWHNNDSAFSLRSKIDKNELVKMAESLKKIDKNK